MPKRVSTTRSTCGTPVHQGLLARLLLCGFSLFLPRGAVFAHTLHHTYRFDASRLNIGPGKTGTNLSAGDLPRTWERGLPEIPYDVVTLVVPQGSRIAAVHGQRLDEQPVAVPVSLAPAAPRVTDAGEVVEPREARCGAKILDKSAAAGLYPAILAEPAGRSALHGYQTVSLRVYPVQYDAGSSRLLVAGRLELDIELQYDPADLAERERYSPAIEAEARRTLEKLVANPEALDSYARRAGKLVEQTGRGFRPSQAPNLEGSPVDYVIITSPALAPSFQVFADWKTRRGVPTVVRTLDWIEANYRRGSDLQETIRTFIRDAYAKWGVRYVLLGGDTDVIPARYGFSAYGPVTEQLIPADTYFACLDGNWNRDGDGVWGEPAPSSQNPGDDVDLLAEVFVGRLPVSTPSQASQVLGKIQTYENPTSTAYQKKLLLLGEVLIPVDWHAGTNASLDGGTYSEQLTGFTTGCESVTKLYENYSNFPGSQPLTKQSAISEMNAGYGFVNHIGHGFRYNMSCGDQSVVNSDILNLSNGSQRFVLYMMNCTAAAFDFPCLAEAYLQASGGAVAVLGASRAAFASSSDNYNRGFFQALYQNGFRHIGEAYVQSRLPYTGNAFFDTVDHYSHLLYNLLGDPEMVVHTCALGLTAAGFPSSVGLGRSDITVHVTVGGSPRAGALVCLEKGVEEYVLGSTNSSGDVTLSFVAESAGSIDVAVSGPNMTTLLGTIGVGAGTAPYVHVQSLVLDDDTNGPSAGNGDGALDAGETLELGAIFKNDGTATANAVTGTLTIDGPWATVQSGTYALGSCPAGGTVGTGVPLRFSVSATTPDGVVLGLRFQTTDGSHSWTDVVNKVVHAPAMELALTKINDFPPGGNGDGDVQAGETFNLNVFFKNYGTGAADGLQASISSADPDILITSGTVQIGHAGPMQEVTGSTAFRLTELTLSENIMRLTLADSHARTRTQNITLRRPAKPAAPQLEASQGAGIVSVGWTPSTDADLFGYHLYRTQAGPGGPWTRVTLDHTVRVAYFRDTGLASGSQYFYQTTAIDSSGNESRASDVSSVNTSPMQLGGWPIAMSDASSCPVAVGDITGDGSKDIVAGDNHLYAWGWNGIELRDDDNDPQTWGVFAQEIGTITGAVLLADLDPRPGLEVFTTVWSDGNKAFVVRGDGSFPNGWPQNPDSGGGTLGYWGAPGAMDLDGDGKPELFAPAKNGTLYAWHTDGTPLGAAAAFKSGLGSYSRCSPTFGSVDADPQFEIVYGAPNGTLHLWNADGSETLNFPVSLGTACLSSTAVGDVDGNGILDVVMITEGGMVNVVSTHTGVRLPGWPRSLPISSNPISPSPALADFDFDGHLEIVVANNADVNSEIRVFDYRGNVMAGWPKPVGSHTSESSPIVADVSGDGVPDILFGNESGLLFGWDKNGNSLAGFPLSVGDFIRSTPWAGDIDGDGDIDLVLVGWDHNVWIWDFTAPYVPAAAQWPTFKHDVQRTGLYGFIAPTSPTDVGGGGRAGSSVPRRAFLAQNVPNPFNPTTSIEYGAPERGGSGALPVTLDIFDVQGHHLRQLVRGSQTPGTYRAVWDARDDRGRRVGSGIYFYRLQVGDDSETKRMILLK